MIRPPGSLGRLAGARHHGLPVAGTDQPDAVNAHQQLPTTRFVYLDPAAREFFVDEAMELSSEPDLRLNLYTAAPDTPAADGLYFVFYFAPGGGSSSVL